MYIKTALALGATLLLVACGGGGTTPSATGGNGNGSGGGAPLSYAQDAISATNAVGAPLKAFAAFEKSALNPSLSGTSTAIVRRAGILNSGCTNGIVFSAPDKYGDAHSTEAQYYYDPTCKYLARDNVRIWTSTGANSETVQSSEKQYAFALSNPPLTAVRQDVINIVVPNGANDFDNLGYPQRSTGYQRTSTGFLNIGNSKTVVADFEMVMQPQVGTTNTFCSDQAGFNTIGLTGTPAQTYGWGGHVSQGTRTVNADGSVTWTAIHEGATGLAALGGLGVNVAATANTTCPLGAPLFTLTGVTVPLGPHTIPVSATYDHGLLTNLSITNAQLSGGTGNGLTLNVQTVPTSNQGLTIAGTLSVNQLSEAVFNVDQFGDGLLTIATTGNQYAITDWHVSGTKVGIP